MSVSRSKRRASGIGGDRPTDLIGLFPINPPKRPEDISISEEVVEGGERMYRVNEEGKTLRIGVPMIRPDTSYDYALAIVNKETNETVFRPATLLSFDPVPACSFRDYVKRRLA